MSIVYNTPEEVKQFMGDKESLRQWNEIHINDDCRNLIGFHENGLFRDCDFQNMNGLTLKNCALKGSKINPQTIAEAQNYTVTLDCNSFTGVEFNELAFDLILLLLIRSKGNVEKRRKLIELVGTNKVRTLLNESYPGNSVFER